MDEDKTSDESVGEDRNLSVLIVDDDAAAIRAVRRVLGSEAYRIDSTNSGEEAVRKLAGKRFDIVLTDLILGTVDGLDILKAAKEASSETEVIIMTGHASIRTAIEAIKTGAFHYLEKPLSADLLRHTVRKAAEKVTLVVRLRELEKLANTDAPAIIGHSPEISRVNELILQIRESDANVLITGETGTGKELVARAIHHSSRRRSKRFLAINCASFTEELLSNELFGHEKDAFTGATTCHPGLIESADGGTLFLDEVADMSMTMQAKVLRVIQEREFLRVGGTVPVPIDIRILSATNRDLKKLCNTGFFRQDLYFRLHVIGIFVPNLAERRGDIPLLAAYFLEKYARKAGKTLRGFSREALNLLMNYGYPGNVRELENIVEHALSLARGDSIQVDDLPADLTDFDSHTFHQKEGRLKSLKEVEADYISWVMDKAGHNKTRAARILGIDRASLYRKMKRSELRDD